MQIKDEWLLKDEELYQLNEANTEFRRKVFWEAGLLDTCKAANKAQLSKAAPLIAQAAREEYIDLLKKSVVTYRFASYWGQTDYKCVEILMERDNFEELEKIIGEIKGRIVKQEVSDERDY